MTKTSFALLLALASTAATAEIFLEALREGAAKAAKTVGETTMGAVETAGEMAGKASEAVADSVDSTQKSLSDEATPAQTRAKLDSMAETTLARLFADEPGSRALFERGAGYAVFDKREASFYYDYSRARDAMFAATDTDVAPWYRSRIYHPDISWEQNS